MEKSLQKSSTEALETKMIDLAKVKEELRKARENATQSWLDSRPLIDELEKRKTDLSNAQNQVSKVDIIISELESQLEAINASIKLRNEEELKAKVRRRELDQALDKTRSEIEKLKEETVTLDKLQAKARVGARLKQELRLKKQTLRTLQLTLRAVRKETEAFRASEADALHHIKSSKTCNTTVKLTDEDHYVLTEKCKEDMTVAEWRVSVSIEQRLMAEASRDRALQRLKELNIASESRKRNMEEYKIIEEEEITKEAEEDDPGTRVRTQGNKKPANHSKAEVISTTNHGAPKQQLKRRSKCNRKKKLVKKKKPSIIYQVRYFLVRNIRKLFG